jgi:flagellar motor protein MotB
VVTHDAQEKLCRRFSPRAHRRPRTQLRCSRTCGRSLSVSSLPRLQRRGRGKITIVGYTDDLGSAQHGLVLSRRRAAAVARVLRPNLDEADYPFSVSGRGEADPAVPNTSEKNRKLNRRVELTYRPA